MTPQEVLRYAHLALDGSPSMGLLDAIAAVCSRDERGRQLADGALQLLHAYVYGYRCVGVVSRKMARWESIRTPDEVLMVLARAADDQAAVRVLEQTADRMPDPEPAPEKVATFRKAPGLRPGTFIYAVLYTEGGQVCGKGLALPDELEEWRRDLTASGWTVVVVDAAEQAAGGGVDEH